MAGHFRKGGTIKTFSPRATPSKDRREDSQLEVSRNAADVTHDPCQMFFTNLLLLGFEADRLEAETRIPFNKSMFSLPNKRGAEFVLHFLFIRLDPVLGREEFRDCWPISDKKREQQFRSACYNWLASIAKEPDANLPRINASLFMSPGGSKFISVILHFSRYVLNKVNERENIVKEKLDCPVLTKQTQPLASTLQKVVSCSTKLTKERQEEILLQIITHDEEWWSKAANSAIKEIRKLTKEIRELEHRVREEMLRSSELSGDRISPSSKTKRTSYDYHAAKRAQSVQEVRSMWQQLEGFFTKHRPEREVVESIVDRTVTKHRISAANISIKVPDLLLRECEQEIRRRHVENTFQNGKLNLVSLLQLWNLSLKLYIERYHQGGVPDFTNDVDRLNQQVHRHHGCLATLERLGQDITRVKPELEKSVDILQSRERERTDRNATPRNHPTTNVGLGLFPPTPKYSFSPTDDSHGRAPTVPVLQRTPEFDSTPEAVLKIQQSIAKQVEEMRLRNNSQKGPKVKLFPPSSEQKIMEKKTRKDLSSKVPQRTYAKRTVTVQDERKSRPAKTIDVRGQLKSTPRSSRPVTYGAEKDTVIPGMDSKVVTMVQRSNQVSPEQIPCQQDASNTSSSLWNRSDLSPPRDTTDRPDITLSPSQSSRQQLEGLYPTSSVPRTPAMDPGENPGAHFLIKSPSDLIVEEMMGLRSPTTPNEEFQAFKSREMIQRTPVKSHQESVTEEQDFTHTLSCLKSDGLITSPQSTRSGQSDKENVKPQRPVLGSDVMSDLNSPMSKGSVESASDDEEGRQSLPDRSYSSHEDNSDVRERNLMGVSDEIAESSGLINEVKERRTMSWSPNENIEPDSTTGNNLPQLSSFYASPKKIIQSFVTEEETQRMAEDVRRMFRESLGNDVNRSTDIDNGGEEECLEDIEEPFLSFNESLRDFLSSPQPTPLDQYSKTSAATASLLAQNIGRFSWSNVGAGDADVSQLDRKTGVFSDSLQHFLTDSSSKLTETVMSFDKNTISGNLSSVDRNSNVCLTSSNREEDEVPVLDKELEDLDMLETSMQSLDDLMGKARNNNSHSPGLLDLDLDDSFIPFKDGFQVEGGTPSHSNTRKVSKPLQGMNSEDDGGWLIEVTSDSRKGTGDDGQLQNLDNRNEAENISHSTGFDLVARRQALQQKVQRIMQSMAEHDA